MHKALEEDKTRETALFPLVNECAMYHRWKSAGSREDMISMQYKNNTKKITNNKMLHTVIIILTAKNYLERYGGIERKSVSYPLDTAN